MSLFWLAFRNAQVEPISAWGQGHGRAKISAISFRFVTSESHTLAPSSAAFCPSRAWLEFGGEWGGGRIFSRRQTLLEEIGQEQGKGLNRQLTGSLGPTHELKGPEGG